MNIISLTVQVILIIIFLAVLFVWGPTVGFVLHVPSVGATIAIVILARLIAIPVR